MTWNLKRSTLVNLVTELDPPERAPLLLNCGLTTLDDKNSTEPQKNCKKHVFWGLTKNTEKHVHHLGAGAVLGVDRYPRTIGTSKSYHLDLTDIYILVHTDTTYSTYK